MKRKDGRAAEELRPVVIETDFTEAPLGSVLCAMGRTRVFCTVQSEDAVPRFLKGSGSGWVTAEYSLLPGSTDPRSEREVNRGRPSGRTSEIQRLIGRSLRAISDLGALGERTLRVDCDVIQADGGTRAASVTGAYVALALALRRLERAGILTRSPIVDSVAAVSVGVVDGRLLLDMPYQEDARAAVDMNVVATGAGRFVEVQATGEHDTFTKDDLGAMTRMALAGIEELSRIQRRALESAWKTV